MTKHARSYLIAAATLLLVLVTTPINQHLNGSTVADASPPGGVSVSPAELNFTLGPNVPSQSIDITVSNTYGVPVNLIASFSGIDESAGLLVPTSNLDPVFAKSLHISQTYLTLNAHASQVLAIEVNDASNLSPGGHYATLLISQTGAKGAAVQAALSLSIFAIKTEGARATMSVSDFKTNGWMFTRPSSASVVFKNTGNVQITPRGVVQVKTSRGPLLAKGIANQQSFPMLPGHKLTSTIPLTRLGHSWLPQHLETSLTYRPDGAANAQTISISQWYIPPLYPLVLAGVSALLYARWRKRPKSS